MRHGTGHDWYRLLRLVRVQRAMAASGLPLFFFIAATRNYNLTLIWVGAGVYCQLLNRKLVCPHGGRMFKPNIFTLFDRDVRCSSCGASPEGLLFHDATNSAGAGQMKWVDLSGDAHRSGQLEAELERELAPNHALFGRPLKAVLARTDSDDVVFRDERAFFVVHLTWSGEVESALEWPSFVETATLAEAKLVAES